MSYGFFMMSAMGQGTELWTPANLATTPLVWLDWDSPITDSSGYASAWSNIRGAGGGSFTQSVGGARPQIIAGLSSRRCLGFSQGQILVSTDSGVRDFGRATSSMWGFVVFAATERTANYANPLLVAPESNTVNRFECNAGYGTGANALTPYTHARRSSAHGSSDAIGPSAAGVMVHSVANFGGGVISTRVNGGSLVSSAYAQAGATADIQSTPSVAIGGVPQSAGSNHRFNGDIYAVIGGHSLLSGSDRQRLEGWGAASIGAMATLPVDHPFRHVQPYVNTPILQSSFASDPVVIGFVADTDSGSVGVGAGPAATATFGTLLNSEPALSSGEGIEVVSSGGSITVTITGLTPQALPAQAVAMDHKGNIIATIALSGSGPYTGTGSGELEDGEVYYLRIEGA